MYYGDIKHELSQSLIIKMGLAHIYMQFDIQYMYVMLYISHIKEQTNEMRIQLKKITKGKELIN